MKLRVQYSAQLRSAVGRPHDELDLPDGSSLAVMLEHLAASLDATAAAHSIVPGIYRPSLLIVINDAAAPVHAAATTELRHGDVVLLLPPIAGG